MTTEEIIEKLNNGEYEIREDSNCDCTTEINGDYFETSGNECWMSNGLWIGESLIAQYIQFDGLKLEVDDEDGEIEERIEYNNLINDLSISDDEENPSHNYEEMLKSCLEEYKNAKFYRDNKRGFANEYEIIIDINGDAEADEIDEDWDELTLEEAASEISYDGDAATQAYNSYRFL